jgi:hypothetical protein
MRRILLVFLVLAFLPAAASALTLQEVVTLSKAGVSEEVLMAMIDRDKTIFAIDANQLIALKRDGVSEKIVIALLKSGRQEPPPTQTPSAEVTSYVPTGPTLVMVGHGPERPNTYHSFDRLDLVGSPVFVYPTPGPFVYQTPYPVMAPVAPWLRTPAPCGAGSRPASGPRRFTDQVNCRHTR